MEFAGTHFIGWLLSVGVWGWLFYLGWRNQLVGHYRLVFLYAVLSMGFSAATLLVASSMGVATTAYAVTYVVSQMTRLTVVILVLLSIYWVFDRPRWRRDWHLLVVPLTLILVEFSQPRHSWLPFRVIYATYVVMVYCGLCAVARHILARRVLLGWNLTMVLLGFTIPGLFHVLNFGAFLSGGDRWMITIWNYFTSIACWLIIAIGMTEYSPPRLVEIPQVEFKVARERMLGSIRILWRLLRS